MPWKSPRLKPQQAASQTESSEIRESGRAPLSEIAKKVKRIEIITGRHSAAQLSGQYRSRFRGQGVQFSDFRVYQFGDDVRHIDWRASARSEETYIKTYEEERELNVLLAADISASTGFGTQGQSKFDVMCLALATIGFSAALNNDRVGLLLFSEDVERIVPAKKGRKHMLRIIDELLTHQSKGKMANLGNAMSTIERVVPQNSTVVLASDLFLHVEKERLKRVSRRHDLVMLHVNDPRDAEFPAIGLVRLQDPETGQSVVIDTSNAKLRANLSARHKDWLHRTQQLIQQSGASVLTMDTSCDVTKELMRFFRRRGRT